MIRIVENNDWVSFTLILVGAVYLLMFYGLQREVSILKFLLQSYREAQNVFLCWIIISVGFCISVSVLMSQYIPIIPRFVEEMNIEGFTLNKIGFMLVVLSGYYFVKTIITAIFYQSIGQGRRFLGLVFVSQKFYFIQSLLLIMLGFVHYYFPIDKGGVYFYYLILMILMFVGKQLFYIFHREGVLPKEWYYKILYICTLQISPLLAVWKFIFYNIGF